MKKLLLGMALTALTCSGASATVTMVPDFTEMFSFDCIEFVSSNGTQSDRNNTGVKITGAFNGSLYRITVDNTSTIGMTNKPVITGIGFYDALTYLVDDPALSWAGAVSFQNSDNPGVNGDGENFDASTDIGVERNSGNIDDKGINPNTDLLYVDFTPKAGVTGMQITSAFVNEGIRIKMHLQSYPGEGQNTGASEKLWVKPCDNGAVPEPSRALFGLLGVMGSVFIRRRPRSKK